MMIGLLSVFLTTAAPELNIQDFGATSGGADDTAAVQRAFDKAKQMGGARIKVPIGTFTLSSVVMPTKTELIGEGPGSVLQRLPDSIGRMITANPLSGPGAATAPNIEDIVIRNLTLRDANPIADYMAVYRKMQQYHLVGIYGVDRLTVDNVDFFGWRGDALYLGSGDAKSFVRHNRDVVIRNCRFDGFDRKNRNAISIGDASGILIEKNSFKNCSSASSPGQIDFEMNKDPGHTYTDVVVQDNTFTDNGGTAIVFDIAYGTEKMGRPLSNVKLLRNVIKNQQRRGILLNIYAGRDEKIPDMKTVIEDNRITSADIPIAIEGWKGVTVRGNSITDTQQGIHVGYGPFGHGVQDVTVTGNTFSNVGFGQSGNKGSAVIIFNAIGVTVTNNNVNGALDSVVLFRGGKGGGEAKRVSISGNKINGRAQGKEAYRTASSIYQLDRSSLSVGG
jgi:hypothetical protein